LSFTQINIFDEIIWPCLSPHTYNKIAREMALARKVQNYTFKIALGPFTQCLVLYLGGLELSGGSDI
jgi:hypothetical protein